MTQRIGGTHLNQKGKRRNVCIYCEDRNNFQPRDSSRFVSTTVSL